MAATSKIAWTEATWNPITGCSMVSPGCRNCYAMHLAGTRLKHHPSRAGLTDETPGGPVWTGDVRLNGDWLDQPLRWRKPRRIFVVAHGDLFHEKVPDEWIDMVFRVMVEAKQHTFQVLTKRPERMKEYVSSFVPPHIWLGTSVENQETAEERIPHLIRTPTAVRWLSMEPLLGPVDLDGFKRRMGFNSGGYGPAWSSVLNWIDWIVIGGESAQRFPARPMERGWVYQLLYQCAEHDTAAFVKQLSQATDPGIWRDKDFDSWPKALQVRQYPA